MAKHGKGKGKFRRYIRGNVDESVTMSTLAARTLVVVPFDDTVNERTLISSLVARWSLDDFTSGGDIGPIMCGIAHSDYSATEITEWIDNTGSWSEADLIAQEVGSRKIRIVGVFETQVTTALGIAVLNNGKAIKTKLNWILNQGQTLDLWVFNLGSQPVATTVPNCFVQGHVNLWPQ